MYTYVVRQESNDTGAIIRHSVRLRAETAETFDSRKRVLILSLAKPIATPKQFWKTDDLFNLLKPTGYVMHHQFNIQQL